MIKWAYSGQQKDQFLKYGKSKLRCIFALMQNKSIFLCTLNRAWLLKIKEAIILWRYKKSDKK